QASQQPAAGRPGPLPGGSRKPLQLSPACPRRKARRRPAPPTRGEPRRLQPCPAAPSRSPSPSPPTLSTATPATPSGAPPAPPARSPTRPPPRSLRPPAARVRFVRILFPPCFLRHLPRTPTRRLRHVCTWRSLGRTLVCDPARRSRDLLVRYLPVVRQQLAR